MPTDGVMRDRIRAEVRRILESVREWLQAQRGKTVAETARTVAGTAIEGGLAVGLGVWSYQRLRRPITIPNLKGDGVLEGFTAWFSDEIGFGAGTIVGTVAPAHIRLNGNAIFFDASVGSWSNWSVSTPRVAQITEDVAAAGWFTAVIESRGTGRKSEDPPHDEVMEYRCTSVLLRPEVAAVLSSGVAVAAVALVEAAKAAGAKLGGKVI